MSPCGPCYREEAGGLSLDKLWSSSVESCSRLETLGFSLDNCPALARSGSLWALFLLNQFRKEETPHLIGQLISSLSPSTNLWLLWACLQQNSCSVVLEFGSWVLPIASVLKVCALGWHYWEVSGPSMASSGDSLGHQKCVLKGDCGMLLSSFLSPGLLLCVPNMCVPSPGLPKNHILKPLKLWDKIVFLFISWLSQIVYHSNNRLTTGYWEASYLFLVIFNPKALLPWFLIRKPQLSSQSWLSTWQTWEVGTSVENCFYQEGEPSPLWPLPPLGRWAWVAS